MMTTNVTYVNVVSTWPDSVMEGETFPISPVIQVLDQNYTPIANKLVFAIRSGSKGVKYQNHYEMKYTGKLYI